MEAVIAVLVVLLVVLAGMLIQLRRERSATHAVLNGDGGPLPATARRAMRGRVERVELSEALALRDALMTALPLPVLLFDASGKLMRIAPVLEGTVKLGYPERTVIPMGILLLVGVILYLIPQTSVLGAVYLAAFLGGAVASQYRVGNPLASHVLFPVYVAALLWGGLALRDPKLLSFLLGRT